MPRLPAVSTEGVKGSGPGGRIEITDIRSKLREIRGEVDEKAETAKPAALTVGVAAVVVVVVVAFVLGRRRGQRKTTWVEIRRL
jgi:pyruvate/2-oxoglutarate dehydrogenase complex dihydrolipoamide acyltransferase (E2) component